MTDADLVSAYILSANTEEVGVDYWLAQEMERRGLRSARTCDLTPKAKRII